MLMFLWARKEAVGVGVYKVLQEHHTRLQSFKSLWIQSLTVNIPAVHLFTPAQGVSVATEREVRCEPTESSRAFWIISAHKKWVTFPESILLWKINHRSCCDNNSVEVKSVTLCDAFYFSKEFISSANRRRTLLSTFNPCVLLKLASLPHLSDPIDLFSFFFFFTVFIDSTLFIIKPIM